MTDSALTLQHVSKRYASHVAVRELSLDVPRGSIYGVLGPNGAGKSTTLRMVMNIISRDAGTISILGRPPEERHALRAVGYLPEERGLYRRMVVLDVIVFFGRLKGMDAGPARREGERWLERMGLAEWRSARVDTLSKGMQQKVQFITTVMHGPELLILDEPQSGLDPVNQEVLKETIFATRDGGGTVVLSTHDMSQAEALCDAVCIIAGGEKVLDGAVADVKRRHRGQRYCVALDPRTDLPAVRAVDELLREVRARVETQPSHGSWEVEMDGAAAASLMAGLAALPVDVDRFQRLEPSLHDIFISLVGDSARSAQRRPGNSEAAAHA